jgi:hypothetical protein
MRLQKRFPGFAPAILPILTLITTLGVGSTGSARADEAFGVRGPAMTKAAKPAAQEPSKRLGLFVGSAPLVALSALDNDALKAEDRLMARPNKVMRYGVGRDASLSDRDGAWTDLANGAHLWVAELVSPNAIGLRLHFADAHLPAGAQLSLAAADDESGAPVELHYGSPDGSPAAKSAFWSGSVFGDRARIEYLGPAGSPAELPFHVDRIQHLYRDPVQELTTKQNAGGCENDVSCFPEWGDLSRAVSGIGFIGDNSLFCTGQLLATSPPADFTPYWLTANHCLETEFEAESAEFFWLYQTQSCNGAPPSLASVPRSRGATLVSTNPQSDYTLLIVEGALPAPDLFWAGWTSKEPANGTDAVAIHHPSGDFKRISFGFKEEPSACNQVPSFGGRKLVRTSWTNAVTEPGSSGSGIFRLDTGQLYGQLLGGPSFCGASPDALWDCYGSFATTYTRIKTLLKAGPDDKSEQNDSCAKARTIKAGTLGGRIVKVNDTDWYKVLVPPGKTVRVDLSFSDANGDIDLDAFGGCTGGDPIALSDSTTDEENVALTNVGSKNAYAYFHVFLADDTRNDYDLNVSFE